MDLIRSKSAEGNVRLLIPSGTDLAARRTSWRLLMAIKSGVTGSVDNLAVAFIGLTRSKRIRINR